MTTLQKIIKKALVVFNESDTKVVMWLTTKTNDFLVYDKVNGQYIPLTPANLIWLNRGAEVLEWLDKQVAEGN